MSGQLPTVGLRIADTDPLIDEIAPLSDEVIEAVARLKSGKAHGDCNISAKLLRPRDPAMIRGLQDVLSAVGQSDTIPPAWKGCCLSLSGEGKGTGTATTIFAVLFCSES